MTINQKVAGAAALTSSATAFSASVPGAGQTFTVASATGYPATGRFTVVLDLGLASEEKILCSSRSGTTFTVETRGYDDTTAQSHTNPTVALKLPATIITALIEHVDGDELAPHATTLPVGTTAGHDTTTRHVFGAGNTALGVPGTPTTITPDDSGSAGTGARPAREDHRHAATTAAAISVGTANTEGTAATFARSDHVHELGAASIDAAALFAAGVVDSTALGANAVIAGKIAAGAINATTLFSSETAVPLGIGSYTPTLTNVTLGSGGTNFGFYAKVGRLKVIWGQWVLGTSGNVTGDIAISLHEAAHDPGHSGFCYLAGAQAIDSSTQARWASIGICRPDSNPNIIQQWGTAGQSWDASVPFNWTSSDRMRWFIAYVTAT